MTQPEQRYQLVITATGEVRDEHGNVVEQNVTITGESVLSEADLQQLEGNQS